MENLSRQPVADQLTHRELEILRLIADGRSNQEIAEQLFITLGTVKWYLKQIYGKLGVGSRTQAIATARAAGLLDGTRTSATESPATPHNLPHQRTPFIGRSKELAAIADRLEDPACRLLTVVGPGGMGKTRLALQAASQCIGAFAEGVYFVSLAPLNAPESIVSTLAEMTHFSFYPGGDPKQQLLYFLRAKQMLLVLDNFEHLLTGASLVADILEAAPLVKVLATSRERLDLQGETVFTLDGMSYPYEEFANDVADYSAVKLFLQSASQVQPDFPMTSENLEAVAKICRQVQGMPLGILLAAAWVGVLSAEEIAIEIEKSLNFLEIERRDLPERQRSLRAAFNHSWNLLGEEDRETFKKLSVFRGSFTREAAQQVAGATLKVLMALVNKSLLRRDSSSGRYEIHELLRQFGAEQLNDFPEESKHIHNLHSAYYADYMKRQWTGLHSAQEGTVLDEIGVEFNNVIEAWNYAVRNCRAGILRGMALSLWVFCDRRLPHPEGAALFERAVEVLEAAPPEQDTEIALGLMLAIQGWFTASEPRLLLKSKALSEKGLVILRKYDCPEEMVLALTCLSRVNIWGLGQITEGKQLTEESLAIAREHGFHWGIASSLLHQGYAAWLEGDFVRARKLGEACLEVAEVVGILKVMAVNAIQVLGRVAMDQGDYREAESQFEPGLRWLREIGDSWGIAMSCSYLGKLALLNQDYERAKSWLQESLDYHKQSGQRSGQYFETLHDVSRLFAVQGKTKDAVELVSCVLEQTRDQKVREFSEASLAELQAALPEEIFGTAIERGKTLDLDRFIAEFLAT